MVRFKIRIRNHGFIVTTFYSKDLYLLETFNKKVTTWKLIFNKRLRRQVSVQDKLYAVKMTLQDIYGYHITLHTEFMEFLKFNNIPDSTIETEKVLDYQPDINHLRLVDTFEFRDNQEKVVDHICQTQGFVRRTAVIPLQTGGGKTISALYSVYKLNVRASITMSSRFMESWVSDIGKFFYNGKDEYIIVDSKDKFCKLIEAAKADKVWKLNFIIFSIDILRNYFKEYETLGKSTYGCNPEDLYSVLGVGVRITDEAHLDIHFQFRHDIHTHVPKSIYLSATLTSLDSFTNKLYEILYPLETRIMGLEWNKYITGVALGYILNSPKKADYKGPKGYSHSKYESWIMSNPNTLENYFRMCLTFLEKGFVKDYQMNQRVLVYFSTIEMCYQFAEYIKTRISNDSLNISAFVATDETDVIDDNVILITTPNKSSTGRDIKGLVTVLSTIAIKSIQTNTQMSGRLRPIDKLFPGVEPTFYYLVCTSIPTHIQYHRIRATLFGFQFVQFFTHNTNFRV